MKKFLSLVAALVIAASPLTVLAGSSPTTKNNGGGYDGCNAENITLSAKGCTAYVNGQWVTSLGDGTYVTSAGNVFDGYGHLLYNINSGKATGLNTGTLVASQYEFQFKRAANDDVTFDHFVGIYVDGVWVDPVYYTARKGSVIVTLKQAFIDTLAVGKHTITAVFDDSASMNAEFTVTRSSGKSGVPNTGEASNIPYMIMLGGAILVMGGAGYLLTSRR